MNKENKRKIVMPFTLEQFKDAIERIKAEYNAGNLNLVGLFEIETLEYYCEKAKENGQTQKQEKLLELYRQLSQDLGLVIEHDTTDDWAGPIDYEYLEINEDSPKALNTFKQIEELEK